MISQHIGTAYSNTMNFSGADSLADDLHERPQNVHICQMYSHLFKKQI